ncbi:cell wall-binding repeat-containing protein [Herbiconiux sp. CPCC 203407]|uniref:Cell wall-binding repeat-containing protein n=1 Tax=Herbiconiux oxytropis TaxID=2970915 RepID=A0AA42BUJ0_9MICO|nr:cell wall-binding repeat-containing protein [Herbiconiux oxytropis]MCS5723650.1 cell wall-binding repeat-containing protein [Herbiconiux oxytropis]MCS5726967.1 cell wall-binding repeat-containing protein [Herbiconiux oxytropis]
MTDTTIRRRWRTRSFAARSTAVVAAAALALSAAITAPAAFGSPSDGPAAEEPQPTNVALESPDNPNAPDLEVSYVTGWNSAAALNDGKNEATNSYTGMWGTWGDPANPEADVATYTWAAPVKVSSSAVYLWQNHLTGDGGVRIPAAWSLEYLGDDGEWAPVTGEALAYPVPELDEANPVSSLPAVSASFDAVTTKGLRLSLTRADVGGSRAATSTIEWEVTGITVPEPEPEPESPEDYILAEDVAARTTPGTAPELPGEVWVIDENGPLHYVAATWQAVDAGSYAAAGTFTVEGDLEGYESQPVTATVHVADELSDAIESVEYATTMTQPGTAPELPRTVFAVYDDGTASSTVPVTWDAIDPAAYADPESVFDVAGTVEGFEGGAIATVFVIEALSQTDPIVTIAFDAVPAGSGWYTTAPTATVAAQETASPVASIEVSLDGGTTWRAYDGPFAVEGQGDVTVTARATAEDGAVGSRDASVKIDTVAPVTGHEIVVDGSSATVTLAPTDAEPGSGVARTVWSDGPDPSPTGEENNMYATYEEPFSVQLTEAARYVHIRTQDAAGNEEETQTITLPAAEPGGDPEVEVDRLAGADRYEVSINTSRAGFPDGSDTVYVASGAVFPDALSAAPAATVAGAPILLTTAATLPAGVKAEIERLGASRIVIVGGTSTVSRSVESALKKLGTTVRIGGADRYEASRNIAAAAFPRGAEVAVLANGTTFADALSAGAAVDGRGPVLLVKAGSSLDAATTRLLKRLGVEQIVVAGGEASVSAGIEASAAKIAETVRLGGADRYEASRTINAHFFTEAEHVLLATGQKFPDALSGSAYAPRIDAPLFTVPGTCIPAETLAQIEALGATEVTLLGGTATLGEAVAELEACTP